MDPVTEGIIFSALSVAIKATPEAIALFGTVKAVLMQSSDPTPAQWAALLQATTDAHNAVQAA